jgi:transcriptional regulator with XRE-family HTH domain
MTQPEGLGLVKCSRSVIFWHMGAADRKQAAKVEDEDSALGRVVALLREARGMTREELAEATRQDDPRGVSPSTVAKLEQGAKTPRPRTLAMLARALGVTTTDLFERADLLTDARDPSGRVTWQTARRIALGHLPIGGAAGALAGGAIGAALSGPLGAAVGAVVGGRSAGQLDELRRVLEQQLGRPLDQRDLEVLAAITTMGNRTSTTGD